MVRRGSRRGEMGESVHPPPPPFFWGPFFLSFFSYPSNNDWFYYIITKIHPLFQNPGSAPGGNKLIKTIRYPHMWRYRWFHWISRFSFKLYLNSLVHHQNIFGSSSKVFGDLLQSSDIFVHFRKFFIFGKILRKSSESGRKSSENHQKRRHQYITR